MLRHGDASTAAHAPTVRPSRWRSSSGRSPGSSFIDTARGPTSRRSTVRRDQQPPRPPTARPKPSFPRRREPSVVARDRHHQRRARHATLLKIDRSDRGRGGNPRHGDASTAAHTPTVRPSRWRSSSRRSPGSSFIDTARGPTSRRSTIRRTHHPPQPPTAATSNRRDHQPLTPHRHSAKAGIQRRRAKRRRGRSAPLATRESRHAFTRRSFRPPFAGTAQMHAAATQALSANVPTVRPSRGGRRRGDSSTRGCRCRSRSSAATAIGPSTGRARAGRGSRRVGA